MTADADRKREAAEWAEWSEFDAVLCLDDREQGRGRMHAVLSAAAVAEIERGLSPRQRGWARAEAFREVDR